MFQVMKRDTRFSAAVRIIAGERWGFAIKQPVVSSPPPKPPYFQVTFILIVYSWVTGDSDNLVIVTLPGKVYRVIQKKTSGSFTQKLKYNQ